MSSVIEREQGVASRVLLVCWANADWELLDPLLEAGKLPALAEMLNRGVMGPLNSLSPAVSPLLWNSLATGHRADRHGVLHAWETHRLTRELVPVSSRSRQVKALWNITTQCGLASHCVNWPWSHPAEPIEGIFLTERYPVATEAYGDPWPLPERSVHPVSAADRYADMRVHVGEISGEDLLPLVPGAAGAGLKNDSRLLQLANGVAESMGTHAAVTTVMETEPWNFLAAGYTAIASLSPIFARYGAGQSTEVAAEERLWFGDVIEGLYRWYDLMLGRLLELAGPETLVVLVSEQGRLVREKPTLHSPQGVVVMAGPRVRRDELLHGASLLDIAPTVLAALGLPVGEDMPGQVLQRAFVSPIPTIHVPSWEQVPGPCGAHPVEEDSDVSEEQAAILELCEMGYAETSPGEEQRLKELSAETRFNHAIVLLNSGRWEESRVLLEQLTVEMPDLPMPWFFLAFLQMQTGHMEASRATLEALRQRGAGSAYVSALLGLHASHEGRYEESLEHLLAATRSGEKFAELHVRVGWLLLRLKRSEEAVESFHRALEEAPGHPAAVMGLAIIDLEAGRFRQASEAALQALQRCYYWPFAHYVLGVAQVRMGQFRRAQVALEVAVSQGNLPAAHELLALALERSGGDREQAAYHRRQARILSPKKEPSAAQSDTQPGARAQESGAP
jgi:tetratricopeptide (TPR) repeat protein